MDGSITGRARLLARAEEARIAGRGRVGWRLAAWPCHPLLFAVASVLALFVNNLRHSAFADIAPALAGALIFAGTTYLAWGAALRRLDARTAVLASLWVAVCLFYADLFAAANGALGGDFAMTPTLPVALTLLAALSLILARWPWSLTVPHVMLNGIALVMAATPAWQAFSYDWRHGAVRAIYDAAAAEAAMADTAGASDPAAADAVRHPDIYYLIFDRYASHKILASHYRFDNSDLMAFLRAKGFYIAEDSRSNYFKTGHSVASTFYMDYLDFLAEDPRIVPSSWQPIYQMLDDHRVARFLKARGYRFVQFGSWWQGTFHGAAADENHPHGFNEFTMLYLRRTMLRPLSHVLPANRLAGRLAWDNGQCQRIGAQIEAIKRIGDRREPVFVFAHFLVPHGPYPFDTEGRCLSETEARKRGDPQGYVDQLAYAGAIMRELVTALRAEGRAPPVIIIQADEGPFPVSSARTWREAEGYQIQIKTGILNAYYFPNGDYRQLYQTITPVNTYRVLFNSYFGTDFPLLADRIYGFPHDFNLYEFFDVTDIAQGHSPPPPGAAEGFRGSGGGLDDEAP